MMLRIGGQVLLFVCLSKLVILESVTLQAKLVVLLSRKGGSKVCSCRVTVLFFSSCGRWEGGCIECASCEGGWVDGGI